MPGGTINDPQLAKSGSVRGFVQQGIANPSLQYGYLGCLQIDKPSQDLGALEPVYCPSSSVRNQWDIVDTVPRTPSLPKADIMQHASRYLTDVWMSIRNRGCLFNLQAVISSCGRPDDFSTFDAKIVFGRSKLTKFDLSNLNALDGAKNEIIDISGSIESQILAFIYPMAFQNAAEVQIVAEVVDGFYYDQITCGDCGAPSDGCQKVYALQIANAGSPGLSSQLAYSLDGGITWAAIDIPTLGGVSASRMAPMGLYNIVVSQNSLAYHYSLFSNINNSVVSWTSQNSGFVAGKAPRCITNKSPSETFIGAAGGYIYFLQNVGSGVSVLTDGSITSQNINDIHYYGRTIVAVGDSNALLYSTNNGAGWTLVTGPAVGQVLTSVWCQSATTWLVGANNGKLYYTTNSGANWTQLLFDAGGFTTINDIQFFDENIGYMACEVGGSGRVYRTTDAGASWQYQGSAISGLPTNQRINVVAPCGYNSVMAVGRKTVGGDGIVAIARNVG